MISPLRRFLSDLPAHTRPNARLLGPLTFLSDVGANDAVEVALRHDVVVGNEREFRELTGQPDPDAALGCMRARLRGSNARLVVMSRGANGSTAATVDEVVSSPAYDVDCRDATGAGDAFVGGLAFGLASRWPLIDTLRLANAVGALTTTALGPQTSQPSLAEACALARLSSPGLATS
jgi:ribokinase